MDNFQHHITEALDFIKDWNFTTKKKAVIKFVLESLSVLLFWCFFFIVHSIISLFNRSIYVLNLRCKSMFLGCQQLGTARSPGDVMFGRSPESDYRTVMGD